jgi:hypothetical protein
MLYMTEAPPQTVWVRSEAPGVTHRLVSTAALVANEGGHLWWFDGFASDLDDPYSCLLCTEAKWKVYRLPCPDAALLAEANADRYRWIAENRVEGIPENADYENRVALAEGVTEKPRVRRLVVSGR